MITDGLQAMMATADLHAPAEAATRILPAVAPLTIDSVAEVRRTALQALADFSKVLVNHSKTLDDQAAAAGISFCLFAVTRGFIPEADILSWKGHYGRS